MSKFRERTLDADEIIPKEMPPTVRPAIEKLVQSFNSAQQSTGEALKGGLSTNENTLAWLRTITVAMPSAPFATLALTAPWAAAGGGAFTPAICMFPGGLVQVRGAIASGTPGTGSGGIFATAPVGFRPGGTVRFAGYGGAGALGLFQVDADGSMRFLAGGGTPIGNLECISYFAEPAAGPNVFSGAGWPVIVRHDFPKCWQAEIAGFSMVGRQQGRGQGAPVLDWHDLGDGSLAIDGIWGLQWNQRYEVSLRLSPEAPER